MSTQGCSVPVGCVLAYAGDLLDTQLDERGWAICDGRQLSANMYAELFDAIGTANGGDASGCFNLPDLQGFFLRGVDATGRVDRHAKTRKAAATGGATGASAGSVESFYTAAPRTSPFFAQIPHLPTGRNRAYKGTNVELLKPGSPASFQSSAGGDDETRPINAYVNFIIKVRPDAALPTGVIIAFAGNNSSRGVNLLSWYRLCDGAELPNEEYSALFKAIGVAHGGSGDSFNLPDYRGRFLRGVDNSSKRDPNSASRPAMALGGSTGDAVGSIQRYATARPSNPFVIVFKLGNGKRRSTTALGHTDSRWNPAAALVKFTCKGGDAESRPVNVYVDYYILFRTDPNTTDIFPIGAVIAFPSDNPPPKSQWLRCDGSSLPNTGQYKALFYAIRYDNGGDGRGKFNLPDYQGYFLRGADRGQHRDPNASTRSAARPGGNSGDNVGSLQGFATATPVTGITGPVNHLPTKSGHTARVIGKPGHVAAWAKGSQDIQVGRGGDAETCPINVNIQFYIKYAAAS